MTRDKRRDFQSPLIEPGSKTRIKEGFGTRTNMPFSKWSQRIRKLTNSSICFIEQMVASPTLFIKDYTEHSHWTSAVDIKWTNESFAMRLFVKQLMNQKWHKQLENEVIHAHSNGHKE